MGYAELLIFLAVAGVVAVVVGLCAIAAYAVERRAQKRQRQADILALRLLDMEHQETMRKGRR